MKYIPQFLIPILEKQSCEKVLKTFFEFFEKVLYVHVKLQRAMSYYSVE